MLCICWYWTLIPWSIWYPTRLPSLCSLKPLFRLRNLAPLTLRQHSWEHANGVIPDCCPTGTAWIWNPYCSSLHPYNPPVLSCQHVEYVCHPTHFHSVYPIVCRIFSPLPYYNTIQLSNNTMTHKVLDSEICTHYLILQY